MEMYCAKCKKVTAFSGEPQLFGTKNDTLILKGVSVVREKIKSSFVDKG